MTIEKQGVVDPQHTPDTERTAGTKQAGDIRSKTAALDDDFTKRAADKVANAGKSNGS